MKILFFGTSEFAIPALKALIQAGYDITAVVTQPDKPAGRKQAPLPSPVKLWVLEHGLKVVQPEKLDQEFVSTSPASGTLPRPGEGRGEVEPSQADLFIVASYSKIIPKEILDLPKYGTLNIHPSLLPKYRGPSPIHAAILNGDSETGVTIIKLDEELDHGDVVANSRFEILNSRFYFKDLHDKLAELGADLLIKTLPDYIAGKIKPKPQEDSKVTFTKIISKDDARINWSKTSDEIERQVRAYHIWPVAWTTLEGKRLKILKVQTQKGSSNHPGSIATHDQKVLVHCGQGLLEVQELQLEGSKKMTAQEFIRGQRNLEGKILI